MTAAPAPERAPSVWEDLLELFYAPRAVFERRKNTPAFVLALIVFVVATIVLALAFRSLMQPIFDAEFQRCMVQAMKKNPNVTQEQMEKGKEFFERFQVIIVGVFSLVIPLLLGLTTWVVGKILSAATEFGQAMMIGVYAMFPRLLENLVAAAQLALLPDQAITSRYSVTLGLGRFVDANTTNPVAMVLLGRIDVFTIWVTVLMAIGLQVTGKLSRNQTIVAGVLCWVIGALWPLFSAARSM
jgi:hypothetical protein